MFNILQEFLPNFCSLTKCVFTLCFHLLPDPLELLTQTEACKRIRGCFESPNSKHVIEIFRSLWGSFISEMPSLSAIINIKKDRNMFSQNPGKSFDCYIVESLLPLHINENSVQFRLGLPLPFRHLKWKKLSYSRPPRDDYSVSIFQRDPISSVHLCWLDLSYELPTALKSPVTHHAALVQLLILVNYGKKSFLQLK